MDKTIPKIMETIYTLSEIVKNQEKELSNLKKFILTLPEIRKQRLSYINKEKILYEMETWDELGVTNQNRSPKIIVSLTSFPERMYDIVYTLYSLLCQTLKPDKVILWLGEEQFPRREKDISKRILDLTENGLTIGWYKDIRSYKKLIPSLLKYPDDLIVTADDDIYYPENWLELLYNSYLEDPDSVHCHRAHKVSVDNNSFNPYKSWKVCIADSSCTYSNFCTTGGGVLFPNKIFHEDVLKEKIFLNCCPSADDIWFWAMSVLNRKKIKVVNECINTIKFVNPKRELGIFNEHVLAKKNVTKNENDLQLNNILKHYPQIIDILKEDCFLEKKLLSQSHFSSDYWENRYKNGGNSGPGSYKKLSEFKAEIVNRFVENNHVKTIVEWGCGDGNQLSLMNYPSYVGIDVSSKAIEICNKKFNDDCNKNFFRVGDLYCHNLHDKFEMSLSLDVIYHLIEDSVFESYMDNLFSSSKKYVCIYSSNTNNKYSTSAHVRHRLFTDYVRKYYRDWKLIDKVNNRYPFDDKNQNITSFSDFYFFAKYC